LRIGATATPSNYLASGLATKPFSFGRFLSRLAVVPKQSDGQSLYRRLQARGGVVMPDQFDWNDLGEPRDAKAEIRAAVRHLLNGVSGSARADIVRDIIKIVRQVADGRPPGQQDPWDDDLPGG
jgi:hypothetical protein